MQEQIPRLSLIIPTYNERENVGELFARISSTLNNAKIEHELICIDDRSPDGTRQAILSLNTPNTYVHTKQGEKGKAFSILEGITHARGEIIGFIDADLQYPPEVIPQMLAKLETSDIVVADRTTRETSWYRIVLSRLFRFLFGKLLLGISVDSQSGLKLFRRESVRMEYLEGVTAWGLDYQMLFEAIRNGAKIVSVPITFAERQHGTSDVQALQVGYELMRGAIRLRLRVLVRSFRGWALALFR